MAQNSTASKVDRSTEMMAKKSEKHHGSNNTAQKKWLCAIFAWLKIKQGDGEDSVDGVTSDGDNLSGDPKGKQPTSLLDAVDHESMFLFLPFRFSVRMAAN